MITTQKILGISQDSRIKVITTIALLGSLVVSAHPDPLRIIKKASRVTNVKTIIKYSVDHNQDPYQLLAIAITESGLNERAYSRTKDSGLMQVNCRWWWKKLGFKNIRKCRSAMLEPHKNLKAAVHIINYFTTNFTQCKGDLVYRCYNGGQGWRRSKNIKKIIHYSGRVKWRKHVLEKHYSGLINFTRLLL
jgi:soluble lytic murein transglycosylase-like protein